jgi:hypothetical protein
MKHVIARASAAVLLASSALAQTPYPDLLYYKFDEGSGTTTVNHAVPGVGSANAAVNGQTLAASGGQFGGALVGVGGTGTANFVDSGWVTQIPGDFTLSFWLDLTAVTTTNPFMYTCGDQASSFRCFTNGSAGVGGIVLRCTTPSMNGVIIPGGTTPTGGHYVAWTFRASTGEMRGYLDGAFVGTAIQTGTGGVSSTSAFKVGTWATVSSLAVGARLDEFRLYSSVLSDTDIANTWNVSLTQGPTVYCTAGTTTNNCVPAISGSGTPSASAPTGFTISVAAVEGQKQGLIFYGIDNTGFAPLPWGPSTSFLCVKSPTQRTPPQASGGTVNACDGVIAIDWNAFIAANPTALGAPFSAGDDVYAQAWFRDPPSPKTTNLSDALHFNVGP